MRCNLGDLVRYIGTNPGNHPNCRGWIGRVIKYDPSPRTGDPAWRVDPPLGKDYEYNWVFDTSLRPIRPDESPEESIDAMRLLTEVPKHNKETV